MAWKTTWAVGVDGRDATSAMNPFLTSIEIEEKDGDTGDTASLEFDDTGGLCVLPRAGAEVAITLGGTKTFLGYTEEPDCAISRGGGRTISVHCVSHDSRGKVKDAQRWTKEGGTFGDFLTAAGRAAGISVTVDAAFAAIARPWWSPNGASFLHLGQRLAREMGAVFKIRGTSAIFLKRGAASAASGTGLATATFDCAGGVINGRAKPFTGRENRTRARATWFDRPTGTWKTEDVEIDPITGAPASTAHGRFPRANAEESSTVAKGRKDKADHDKGSASLTTDLRLDVVVGAPAVIANWRAGVDGEWRVKAAKHHLDRGGGGRSEFTLARPGDDVGKDGRKRG